MRPHGSYARYVAGRCRCSECRAANRDYERSRRAAIEPPYVDAADARAHLAELSASGVGLKTVARVSGVSTGTLSRLVYGTASRGPSRRVRWATHDAIMAVSPADAAPCALVDAAATWALIDEMVAGGVPRVAIGRHIGQRSSLQLSRGRIQARHARSVAGLHRAWSHGDTPAGTSDAGDISELLDAVADVAVARRANASWRRSAACRGRPTWLWFPARGDLETGRAGKRVCGACTVRAECLAAHIDEIDGTFGGLFAGERRALRRERARGEVAS